MIGSWAGKCGILTVIQLLWVYLKRIRNNCSEFCKYWVLESKHDWTIATTYTTNKGKKKKVHLPSQFSSVTQSFPIFANPWTAARQASLSIINSRSLLRLMSIESVMPSNISWSVVPFSFYLQSFLALGSFLMSHFFASGGQSIGASVSASILPMNIQDWFPLGLTGWSPYSPRNSQESSPTPQFKIINSSMLSLFYCPVLTSIHEYWKNHSFDYTDLYRQSNVSAFNMLSRLHILLYLLWTVIIYLHARFLQYTLSSLGQARCHFHFMYQIWNLTCIRTH